MLVTLFVALGLSLILIALGYVLSVLYSSNSVMIWLGRAICLLALPPLGLALYIVFYLVAPRPDNHQFLVSDGIQYTRTVLSREGVTSLVHTTKIHLNNADISVTALPAKNSEEQNIATTLSYALAKHQALIGINASFFAPFREKHLLDYYPHQFDPVSPVGQTVSDHKVHGKYSASWPKLVGYTSRDLDIVEGSLWQSAVPNNDKISFAVSGRSVLVRNSKRVVTEKTASYPRTAVGLDVTKKYLYLVVVDGKQPGYSGGMSLQNLADYLLSVGVSDAIELDGGGSSTMAWSNHEGKVELLNRPAHTKIPNRERPVANHLLVNASSAPVESD